MQVACKSFPSENEIGLNGLYDEANSKVSYEGERQYL